MTTFFLRFLSAAAVATGLAGCATVPGDAYYEPAYHPAYGEPPVYIYPQPYIVRPYPAPPPPAYYGRPGYDRHWDDRRPAPLATGGGRTGTTHAIPTATVTQTGPAPRAPTAPTAESPTASPRAANPAANPPRKGLTGYGATHALQPRGKVRKMAAALEGAPPCRVPGPEPCQQTLP